MKDTVNLSPAVANGISLALHQDFNTFESPERMAFVVLLLRLVRDNDEWFSRGKWATIQNIEGQLEEIAREIVEEIVEEIKECPHANLVISEVGLMCRNCGSFRVGEWFEKEHSNKTTKTYPGWKLD